MTLLEQWEEQFKKGQLTLWVFISLIDGEKSAEEMIEFIQKISEGTYTFDIQSIYRSLRNFVSMELISFRSEASSKGPDRKIYVLNNSGKKLLKEFYERNLKVFNSKDLSVLVKKITA